ncbi:MAG: hypothetical protein A2107_08235 [Verrucomicrobia bacterium GWF2_62_7]|nr:MAG: hypothetical protein A2107_08235 [Verrucomicrobia bacterium GWF2_62_7]
MMTRKTFLAEVAAVSGGLAFLKSQQAAAGEQTAATILPEPREAPKWARKARILSAEYRDAPNLARAREEFRAAVMLLYCCPETTNGWCPAGTWDQIAFFIQKAHEQNLKVVCYYDTTTTEESFLSPERREWVQTTIEGKPCTFNRPHVWHLRYAFCYNTPWSQHVARIARRYVESGADGIFLDNPQYYSFTGTTCFCKFCRQAFKQETGQELAQADEAVRIAFHQKSLREHVKRVYAAASEAAQGKQLVITCNTSNPALPMQRLDSLGRAENVIFRETGAHKKMREKLRADAAVFPKKPLWVILTERSGSKVWINNVSTAAAELDGLLGSVIELGLCPMVWATIPSQDPLHPGFTNVSIYNQPELAKVVAKHFSS